MTKAAPGLSRISSSFKSKPPLPLEASEMGLFRLSLMDYFGERTGACGNCDCCLRPAERLDGTEEARMILSAVQRSGERFGAAHVIDILRGTETEKIVRFGQQVLHGQ